MSTLKTNNIQHVDRSDPSIIINTDGSVNIAGTMTYEDVTNVDAVGIITGRSNIDAQKQVHVGTGVSIKSGGINVTAGISTFVDASVRHVTGVGATFSTIRIGKTGGQGKGLEIYQASDAALRIQNSTTGTGSNDGVLLEANGSDALLINYESGHMRFGTAGTERMRITSAGLVGIGITNPTDARVRIKGANNSTSTFNDGLMVTSNNETVYKKYSWAGIEAQGGMLFSEAASSFGETMRITSDGNLLVGTTSSAGRFCVQGAAGGVALQTTDATNSTFRISHPSSAVTLLSGGSSQHLALGTGFAEKMRIDSSGRLLLAATTGTARLHIKGNGGDGIKIENSGGTNGATIDLKNTLTNYVQEYRIAVAGSDGAYGTAKALFVRDQTAGANRFEVQAGGDVKVSTGNLLIGTAGKGVNFSAFATSGNPSSNLLDDYEEGIATFTLHINGGAWSGASYSYNTAPYVKVGRMVFCAVSMFATNLDGTTGTIDIDGLPFTDGGGGGYREPTFVAANHALGTNPSVLYGAVIGSSTKIRLRKAGSADLNGSDVAGTFWFHGSLVYMANA